MKKYKISIGNVYTKCYNVKYKRELGKERVIMVSVTASIKIDPELKRESQALFESFGLSWSAAINLFLRQAVREQAIPFRVGSPVYNEETLRTIQEARQGKHLSKPFQTVEALMEDLESDEEADQKAY